MGESSDKIYEAIKTETLSKLQNFLEQQNMEESSSVYKIISKYINKLEAEEKTPISELINNLRQSGNENILTTLRNFVSEIDKYLKSESAEKKSTEDLDKYRRLLKEF